MVVFEVQKPKKSPLGADFKNLSSRFQEATAGPDFSLIDQRWSHKIWIIGLMRAKKLIFCLNL